MFQGGPLNPRQIDIYTVGREGSHHIQVAIEPEFVATGFFGETDSQFIAEAHNQLPRVLEALDVAVEALEAYERANGEDCPADIALAKIKELAGE